jgi:hypothetical protein
MEIPGLSPLSGQPTITNPLSQPSQLQGRVLPTQAASEAQNTQVASEQGSTSLTTNQVVEQVNNTEATGFREDNPGGTIDITI